MKDQFEEYIKRLYQDVPVVVYGVMVVLFIMGSIVFFMKYGPKKGKYFSTGFLLIEYVILLLISTVFLRSNQQLRQYNFHPFWSYNEIMAGKEDLIVENVMNIVVFIPVGLLAGFALNIKWWKVSLMGMGVSSIIEILQFVFKRGFSEVDDLIHNVAGCVIGFVIYKGVSFVLNDEK